METRNTVVPPPLRPALQGYVVVVPVCLPETMQDLSLRVTALAASVFRIRLFFPSRCLTPTNSIISLRLSRYLVMATHAGAGPGDYTSAVPPSPRDVPYSRVRSSPGARIPPARTSAAPPCSNIPCTPSVAGPGRRRVRCPPWARTGTVGCCCCCCCCLTPAAGRARNPGLRGGLRTRRRRGSRPRARPSITGPFRCRSYQSLRQSQR